MNKQTFTIPEGCTEISVEQDGDKLIATFGKSSKVQPKQGDVITINKRDTNDRLIVIVNEFTGIDGISFAHLSATNKLIIDAHFGTWGDGVVSFSTKEESKEIFDALEKEGLQWNAELKKLEKMRWKPEYGQQYFCVSSKKPTFWHNDVRDDNRFRNGDCFKTYEDKSAALDLIRQTLINFHNEN